MVLIGIAVAKGLKKSCKPIKNYFLCPKLLINKHFFLQIIAILILIIVFYDIFYFSVVRLLLILSLNNIVFGINDNFELQWLNVYVVSRATHTYVYLQGHVCNNKVHFEKTK